MVALFYGNSRGTGGIQAHNYRIARRSGHGVAVLLKVYANCIDGRATAANQRISDALNDTLALPSRLGRQAKAAASGPPRGLRRAPSLSRLPWPDLPDQDPGAGAAELADRPVPPVASRQGCPQMSPLPDDELRPPGPARLTSAACVSFGGLTPRLRACPAVRNLQRGRATPGLAALLAGLARLITLASER